MKSWKACISGLFIHVHGDFGGVWRRLSNQPGERKISACVLATIGDYTSLCLMTLGRESAGSSVRDEKQDCCNWQHS